MLEKNWKKNINRLFKYSLKDNKLVKSKPNDNADIHDSDTSDEDLNSDNNWFKTKLLLEGLYILNSTCLVNKNGIALLS